MTIQSCIPSGPSSLTPVTSPVAYLLPSRNTTQENFDHPHGTHPYIGETVIPAEAYCQNQQNVEIEFP